MAAKFDIKNIYEFDRVIHFIKIYLEKETTPNLRTPYRK